MRVGYPIALDSDYAVWQAFANRYWPALYIVDAQGRIRHHQFGEGGYDECERVIQQLLREAGADDVGDELVSVADDGIEAQADWTNLGSPETYLGYEQGRNFAQHGRATFDEPHDYVAPASLELNDWALTGDWTIEGEAATLNRAGGRLDFRFHARDVNLVLAPTDPEGTVRFRVLVDGLQPGPARGLDIDERGEGRLVESRLYQLVRQPGAIRDRTFEITFLDPGARGYVFTFG
jgi:hypothetical protein